MFGKTFKDLYKDYMLWKNQDFILSYQDRFRRAFLKFRQRFGPEKLFYLHKIHYQKLDS